MAYTSPFDIPDDDPEFQAFKTQFLGTGKEQNDPGFVTGIKQGLGGFTSGVGQVAEDLGWKNNPIKSYGDEVQANNPSSAASQSWEGFKEAPWQGVKEFAGQGIGSTLPSLAAFLLPGGQGAAATGLARVGQVARGLPMQTALAAAPIYGQVREDQQRQGFDAIPAAAAAAIGGGIVESKLGIQRVLGKATDKPIQSFVRELASSPLKTGLKTWGRTGLEEGAEEIIQQPMQQLGAHRNPLTEESLRDTAWSGFGGLIGGLAMGGVGGAKMGLAHKRVDDFRQADLLNPETPLDTLDSQAQWNQAFIERDQGAEAGQRFYDQRQAEIDQYVESLVDPYRRQVFADQNRQIDLLADQERIAARAPSYLGQKSDYNPDDERVLNAVDRPNPADYRNWWENVPDPNNPEAYQQFWQHVTDGQESVRDVKRDALGTPLNQELPPGYTPVSFRSNGNAATQVAQESGQGASGVAGGSTGNTQTQTNAPATQGVKPGTKGALEAAVTELMPEESTERQDHINAIQTAKSYTTARKALAKMSPHGLKIALRSAPQEEQRVVQTALGWDSQGNQVGSRIASYADVAKASGLNSRQRVQQILKSYGIDSDVINRMNAADQQAVSVSELMPSQQEDGGAQDGTGFRIMDNPNASDDFDVKDLNSPWHVLNQAEQARLRGDKTVPSNEEIIKTLREAEKPVQDTNDNVQTAEERVLEERKTTQANDQREEMLREVASDYNSDIEEGDAPFERLDTDLQEKYIDAFEDFNEDKISARDLMRIFSEVADEAKARNAVRGGDQSRLEGRQNTSGQLPGLVQSQEAVSGQTQDASRAEQASSTEGSADGVKQSRGVEGSTQASAIEGKLKPLFFSSSRFSNRVVVVQSAAALPQNLQSSIDGNTQAFVQGGKVYMIADNIAEGKELAVFLHEVGVHLGMKGLIGQENLNRLAMQIKRWAVKNDGSVESEIAKKALSRVKSAQQGGVDMELGDVIEERVAYFVEEAVNAGINPTALSKSGGPLQQWFRTLWAAVKVALRKFGLDRVHTLTAQNLVDLSYGAARLELEGTWHGTAADFRNFNHDYMGSGEGAQAFGWGTYLAQRVGIAKGYWKDDVKRKKSTSRYKVGDTIKDGPLQGLEVLALPGMSDVATASMVKVRLFGSEQWVNPGSPEGSLMRVDSAVHEDEMLDWDKPLSEQSEAVKKALESVGISQRGEWNPTGGNLYRTLQNDDDRLEDAGFDATDKGASEYLDSIGIKGIKFLDAQSRDAEQLAANAKRHLARLEESYANASANYEANPSEGNLREKTRVEKLVTTARKQAEFIPTRNLVIFNDKNIQRVTTQVGADRERIKFSKSSNIAQTNPQYRKTSTLVRQTLEYLGNKFQSVENNTMFGHQLAQKAERLMPGTSRYFKSLIQRQTERVKHEQEIAHIANRYNELETRDQNALNAFVQKSTMDGKWGFKPTWFEKDVQTPVDPAMKTEFDKLTPEAQQIAKDMFKFGSEQQKRFDASVNANITDPKKKVQRNHMYGKPYAPLKRFGDHVVVGKSAEFVAEEKAHPGSKRLEEMKADENHYYVEFTDGNWESIKRRDEMAATNPNMTWGSKPLQLENRALNSVNMTILEKLKNQIEASDNKSADATKGALKSLANQLYIQQLNQMHANKSQAKRLKVKGAEADMMKAFVSQGRAEAALIANLMTHAESEAGLQQIQTAARTGDNQDAKTRVANAVLRRHLAMLDFQPTPIQNKLMGANSFMMLLTSPAYYLTNATQPFVVSMPYMAGRFGGANSWNTLRDAYKTTLELVKLSTLFKDQNLDAAHLKKFNSVGREAEALQVLLNENLVNVGMEMELGDIASQSKNPAMKNLQKGLQVLKTGVANVEVLNRLSTAVAAYRLAYAEALNKGSSKDAAHEAGTSYARQTIIDTHGDYAGYNAPTVMMQGAFGSMPVKLMTQFKKFQFIQAGLLVGTFRDAYLRGNLNENEKAAAKAMFKWMLGTQAALAGALGGVTGVPMALLGAMMAGIFGDDGEDKEAFLRRILGGGAFAQLILHGAPAAAGVDISKRIGMGAALDPFRMADPQTDWSDYALSLAGPSAGLASRTASGLNYIGKGQYWKGLEMLMPSGILTNASKIARYEAEGLTNSRGDVVMKPEEISLMTDLMQGLGLETTQLSDRRWKAGAIYDRGIHFKEKTSRLQRQYVDAFKDGDQEELMAIRQEWMKLQAERVNQGFKRENMTALTQAPMAQKKRERETVNGLQTTQTNRKFVESMDTL